MAIFAKHRAPGLRMTGLAALLAFGAPGAHAGMIGAGNVAPMAELLRSKGLTAEVHTPADDDPYISSESEGGRFLILYMNCDTRHANCKTVQFYLGFTNAKNLKLDRLNQWNRDSRFARAFIDEEGDPVLKMDLDLDYGGLPRANVAESLSTWLGLMQAYRDFVYAEISAKGG